MAVFGEAHLGMAGAAQISQIFHVAHRHDALAIRAVVGLHDHKGFFVDSVFFVFALYFSKERINIRTQAVQASAF